MRLQVQLANSAPRAKCKGAVGMGWWLGAMTAFLEDPTLIPNVYVVPKDPVPPSGHFGNCTHLVSTHAGKTPIHACKIVLLIKFNKI